MGKQYRYTDIRVVPLYIDHGTLSIIHSKKGIYRRTCHTECSGARVKIPIFLLVLVSDMPILPSSIGIAIHDHTAVNANKMIYHLIDILNTLTHSVLYHNYLSDKFVRLETFKVMTN